MNISDLILEFLKQNGTAKVPGFGIFTLENAKALISPDQKSILPPSKQIVFTADYQLTSSEFLNYLSIKNQTSEAEAGQQLTHQTDYWKKKLLQDEQLDLPPLGKFQAHGNDLTFVGARFAHENPDFYGLEEIHLADIRKEDASSVYRLNKTLLWTVLLIGIAALGTTAYFNQDLLFGKKSFSKVQPLPKKVPAKPDSTLIRQRIADSLKTDSLKKDSTTKAAALPAKKWSGKKYSNKNKWSKQTKRQTR